MKITLRETKNLNFEKVVDIFFEVKFLRHQSKREIYKKAIEKAFRNSQFVVSAWDGNELVGFARVLSDDSLFATIWNMLIKPSYQKKGIGKMLVQQCLNKFPNLHFFLIASEEVIEFYRRMGFDVHQFGMYLKDGPRKCIIYN